MIDLHSDTLYRLYIDKSEASLDDNSYSVDAKKMRKGGVKAQCFAIFTPIKDHAPEDGLSDYERMCALHDRFTFEMNRSKYLKQAKCIEDIKSNSLSAILTVEDLSSLEGDEERLKNLASWGVMIASITWNYENVYAYPCSLDKMLMQKPLKKKGYELLEQLKAYNIAVDVSHLNDGGFYSVASSGVKMLATHSNCRAITNVPRNLTDEMLVKLADCGGVAGLNFCPSFLRDFKDGEERVSEVDAMVRHVMHAYKVAGEDVLALGTDFDGIGGRLQLENSAALPQLFEALKKAGLPASAINKMKEENVLRLLS